MSVLTYTQHSVAFPRLWLNPEWHKDQLNIVLHNSDTGEFKFVFMELNSGTHAVQVEVFGDGLDCFYDHRVQDAISQWRALPDPDEVTPDELIRIFESVGAEPSRYHREGMKNAR